MPLTKAYHHYVGAQCVARYPIKYERDGVYLLGPIRAEMDEDGHPIPGKWDETGAKAIAAGPFQSEDEAIIAVKRKLAQPRPKLPASNGRDAFAKWKGRHTEREYPDAVREDDEAAQ